MRYIYKTIFSTILFILMSTPLFAKEPVNLSQIKQQLIFYHDSGEYYFEQESMIEQAFNYLKQRIAENARLQQKENLAIVLDIDETSLSNYQGMFDHDFGKMSADEFYEIAQGYPIAPTLGLYKYAKSHGVAVYFITGRSEEWRQVTEDSLNSAGYSDWDGLYLKPDNYPEDSITNFKTTARSSITDDGFTIVVNLGDQYSDLVGGYAEKVVKLPNPYYFIP